MSTIRIIFADLNVHELHMYKEDGTKIVIPQGDPRIAKLVNKVFSDMRKQNFCDLPESFLEKENHYQETEKKMNGFVRFFKMAKAKFDEIIGNAKEPVVIEPRTAGDAVGLNKILHPSPVAPVITKASEESSQEPLTKSEKAVAEIMAHAKPSSDSNFAEDNTSTETTVAVLADGTVIENADKLKVQLQAVNAGLSSQEGLKNFLNRMASVSRAHSAQDLLTFMEKGELPIADDGTVLVYKRLRSTDKAGVYVDCHSGKVKQKVGSFVFMATELVDPNRHNECSNGLHVARRDYLNSFSGDVCVLAKLAPEDVIAVPHGDPRKLRAKGYHIIAVLSDQDARNVCSDRPLTDKNLLGNAIAGNHVGVLQTVEIRAYKGGDLLITDLDGVTEHKVDETLSSESLDHLPEAKNVTVDAVALAVSKIVPTQPGEAALMKTGEEVKASIRENLKPNKLETLLERYKDAEPGSLDEHVAATELVAFKKAAKKSWTALGVPVNVFDSATSLASQPAPVPVPKGTKPQKHAAKPVKKPVTKPKGKGPAKPVVKATRNIGPITKTPVNGKPVFTVAELVVRAIDNKSQDLAEQAITAKKAKKKGWTALGVNDAQAAAVIKLAGK